MLQFLVQFIYIGMVLFLCAVLDSLALALICRVLID